MVIDLLESGMAPPDRGNMMVTANCAEPALDVRVRLPLPALSQVIWIKGTGAVLVVQESLVPEILPPATQIRRVAAESHGPAIIYWYTVPGVTQVGPVTVTCP